MKQEFDRIHEEAHKAGLKALAECVPEPMIVCQHANMIDDSSPVVRRDYVADGLCGFAWINVRPGTCSFAKYLKTYRQGYKDYYGGISIHVREGNQSIAKKEAYAGAFAEVLCNHDINASAESRLD